VIPAEGGPFASDNVLAGEISRLVSHYGIRSAAETGTYQGVTTRALAAMVPEVHTIEISDARFEESGERLADLPHVQVHHGSSEDILRRLIPQLPKPALYYLDAHDDGAGLFPLPAEVNAIGELDPSPVIVMHDMAVPGHPELHADTQPDGTPYDLDWVMPGLEKIREPWRYYYNTEAVGLRIGILFVVPDVP